MSGPRIPMSQMNGGNKRPNSIHRMAASEKPYCSQHDDLIKFIFESWDKVHREGGHGHGHGHGHSHSQGQHGGVTYYQEQEPNPELKDFEPFDLEAWWGQRLVQNMTQPQHS